MARTHRDELTSRVWDVVIVGGGVTGAGLLYEAASRGLSCLAVEGHDFGWGASSRSGKLVHGGIRYLKQGQFKTTWHSVREREKLIGRYAGLIDRIRFLYPVRRDSRWGKLISAVGLGIYDVMAGRRDRRYHEEDSFMQLCPALDPAAVKGVFSFSDALTDDARLVFRVLMDARRLGGVAVNYAPVVDLIRSDKALVEGVVINDEVSGDEVQVRSRVVINATGAWTDDLRSKVGRPPKLRRLRGSHLLFLTEKFPIEGAVGVSHPEDGRPLYAIGWEGMTLFGTTDLDHDQSMDTDPWTSRSEGDYLLAAINEWFPSLGLGPEDVVSTFSGVRPVVDTGKADPSKESREHVIWSDHGLVTVTGGKLTTFMLLARETLRQAGKWIGVTSDLPRDLPQGTDLSAEVAGRIGPERLRRLSGRYGPLAGPVIEEGGTDGLEPVGVTNVVWAELLWAAAHEDVVHLDDLLLRRVRLGNLLTDGGRSILGRIKDVVAGPLGWDDERWAWEAARYLDLWQKAYSRELISK